jgi:hypothetical protein
MTIAGVIGLIYVVALYPRLTKILSSKYVLVVAMFALTTICVAVPPLIGVAGRYGSEGNAFAEWAIASLGVCVFALGTETGFPASMVLTGNVVEQRFLGSVHGVSQSIGSLIAALAPISSTSLFAWSHALPTTVFLGKFNSWIMWVFCGILSFSALLVTMLLPRGLDRDKK